MMTLKVYWSDLIVQYLYLTLLLRGLGPHLLFSLPPSFPPTFLPFHLHDSPVRLKDSQLTDSDCHLTNLNGCIEI